MFGEGRESSHLQCKSKRDLVNHLRAQAVSPKTEGPLLRRRQCQEAVAVSATQTGHQEEMTTGQMACIPRVCIGRVLTVSHTPV